MGLRHKKFIAGICLTAMLCGMTACGKAESGEASGTPTPEVLVTGTATVEPEATVAPTEEPVATPKPTHVPAKIEDEEIPYAYRASKKDFAGTVEYITYQTKDYHGTGEEITKPAYVYLPHGYDAEKQYNVLFLMHSGGGDETQWDLDNPLSSVRLAMDNLVYYGDVEPFIIVTPNGRAGADFANMADQSEPFERFGQELRNDLIPYIDANYATYADYSPEGYDASASRDHRAIAGFSFGGMQAINIGMCECLDLFSYFGPFAPAGTSYWSEEIAAFWATLEEDYEIHCIYNICGTADNGCMAASYYSLGGLPQLTDKVVADKNIFHHAVPGSHDMTVGKLGFYNFAQLVFK